MKVGIDAVLLGAWSPITPDCKHILDIGTGTGVIALLAAERANTAQITGIEINAEAAAQAKENAQASPFNGRIEIIAGPVQDFATSNNDLYDLIITNPPFFSGGVLSDHLDRQTARHTVKLSHQDLLRSVQQLLSPKGTFCCILPKLEGLRFIELAASVQLYPQQVLRVRPRAEKPVHRLLLAFSRMKREPEESEIIQYGEEEKWTEDFTDLVGGFYPEK